MNISGIYQIKSTIVPSRIYIGSAGNIFDRWRKHLERLRKNKHHSRKLQAHYNKYGEDDLLFSVVAVCDREELIPINKMICPEQFFIWAYDPWFNINPIAGSCRGVKRSRKTRDKISDLKKGVPLSKEHRMKISKGNKGVKRSAETKARMKKTHIGALGKTAWNKGLTKETDDRVRKYGDLTRGKSKISSANEKNKKPINQYTKDGVFIKVWCSITEASKSMNIGRSNIRSCSNGKLKSAGGYIWSFV